MTGLVRRKEKQLDRVSDDVHLRRIEAQRPDASRIDRTGHVSVRVHDGTITTAPMAINACREGAFPVIQRRPGDPSERARIRLWRMLTDDYLQPALSVWGRRLTARKLAPCLSKHELDELLAGIPLAERSDECATIVGGSLSAASVANSRRKREVACDRFEKIRADSTRLPAGAARSPAPTATPWWLACRALEPRSKA